MVVYDDGGPPKLINLYDGVFSCFDNSTNVTFGGFRTPAVGPVSARFSAWCEDGHKTIVGESIKIGSVFLSNSANPSNNIGNSSVSDADGPITRDPMTIRVTESIDIDTFNASSAFTTGQTSVTTTFTCGTQEGVYYHGAVLAFDVVAPTVTLTKTVVDLDGAPLSVGEVLEYTLGVAISGADDANAVVIRDAVPANTTFVAGSLQLVDGPAAGSKTDALSDDEAQLEGNDVVFTLGDLSVGTTRTVKFRVTVNDGVGAATITNRAVVAFQAASGGGSAPAVSVQSNEVSSVVVPPTLDLASSDDLLTESDLLTSGDDLLISDDLSSPVAIEDLSTAEPVDLTSSVDASTPPALTIFHDGSFTEGVDLANLRGASKGGCGCSTTPSDDRAGFALGLGLVAIAIRARRRKAGIERQPHDPDHALS